MKNILRISLPVLILIFAFGTYVPNALAASPGDVIINEFSSYGTFDLDWIELLNTTGADISLSGWKLQDLTFSGVASVPNITGTATTTIGAVTIPANGIVTLVPTSGGFNQAGDMMTLYDGAGNQIHAVSYGSITLGSEEHVDGAPSSTDETASRASAPSWSIGTPTKGWFNGAPAPTVASIVAGINGGGVATNWGTSEIPNSSAATNLYFEKRTTVGDPATALGKLTFAGPLNLTNASTTALLQDLGNKMNSAAGSMKFDARTATDLKNAGATISIYRTSTIGYGNLSLSDMTVKDDDGNILTGGALPSLTLVATSTSNGGTFTFTTDHFTQFGFDPILQEITAVPTPATSTSPSYTFSSNVAGTTVFGGDCSQASGTAVVGNNTVTFGPLALGTHSNCTIKVVDGANASTTLSVTAFTIVADTSNADAVAADKAWLVDSVIKNANADLSHITGNLTLPTTGTASSSAITWASSNNTAIATSTGVVTRPAFGAGNATVTLTATISKGPETDTKTFTAIVLESLNSAKAITSFSFTTPAANGVISESAHTISVNVPFGTDITALVPTITITGASVNPNSLVANNFTATSTYTVTAANASTQAYAVKVNILESTQKTPDAGGNVTINSTTPEVVITNPTQAVDVTISSGTTNPTIDVSSFITGGTGTLPAITITSANANNTNVEIPASTVVTSASTTWDGVIAAPTVTTVSLSGTQTLSTAIEIGFSGEKLSFNKAVRILLVGQAGKRAGYVRTGIAFTEITNVCSADTQVVGDALAADSDCKIDAANGLDLVIWTKHFTAFATYTQASRGSRVSSSLYPSPETTSSGSVAVATTPVVTTAPIVTPVTVVQTAPSEMETVIPVAPPEQGQVLGAQTYNFVKNLGVGSRGADVTALQQFLLDNKFYSGPVTGYFGQLTKAAVIAFQKEHGIAQTGNVSELTRAELNKGSVETTTENSSGAKLTADQVNSIITVLQSFGVDESVINSVRSTLK